MAPSGSVQGRAACRVGQALDRHGQIDGIDKSADKAAVDQDKNSVRSEHQFLESMTRTVIEMTQKSEVTNNETCNRAGIRMPRSPRSDSPKGSNDPQVMTPIGPFACDPRGF